MIAAFGVTGGCAALFFGGGLLDAFVGSGLSLLVGLGVLWMAGNRLSEFGLALFAALGAGVLCRLLPVSGAALTLAALVVLLPGLSLVPPSGGGRAHQLPILTFPGNLGDAGTLLLAWQRMQAG